MKFTDPQRTESPFFLIIIDQLILYKTRLWSCCHDAYFLFYCVFSKNMENSIWSKILKIHKNWFEPILHILGELSGKIGKFFFLKISVQYWHISNFGIFDFTDPQRTHPLFFSKNFFDPSHLVDQFNSLH